jgi:hypothetical protein
MTGKIVVTCEPVWAQAEVVKVLYGLPKPTLMRLASEGKIRSRRLDDRKDECGDRTTRVYRCSDVTEWIEKEAVDPESAKQSQEVA